MVAVYAKVQQGPNSIS